MPLIPVPEIEAVTLAALQAHGAAPRDAQALAKATAHSEAHGNVICGLAYLESYCQQLANGRVKGQTDPSVERLKPGVVRVNAGLGFAQHAFDAGFDAACAAAKDQGIALYMVTRSHTCTSLGYFTEQFARAGLMALGFTNAAPSMAPPGGNTATLGTNPIAVSCPAEGGGLAMHFDTATSAVARGDVLRAKASGTPIPLGWAVDAEGAPTEDAEAALAGALLPAAGHKGWGLGLLVEVMAAALGGTALSADTDPLKVPGGAPHNLSQSYILIDPTTSPVYFEKMSRLSALVTAQEGARIPGATRKAMEQVDVPEALWATVQRLASGNQG
ncbi:MAG: Ldh family oxidoreductase [Pseudomonadota bacterium]